MGGAFPAAQTYRSKSMAKVKYLGDPENEARTSITIGDVECPKDEVVKMSDDLARNLVGHPHFEVQGVRAPAQSETAAADPDEVGALSAQLTQAMATIADLQSQLDERGQMLTAATQRIAELEAQLMPPAA